MMIGQNNADLRRTGGLLVDLTLIGTLLFPSFGIVSGWPKFEISDLTFPLLLVLSVFRFRDEMVSFYRTHRGMLMLGALMFIAMGSIIINGRMMEYRDWFEPVKFLKLACFIFFFYAYADEARSRKLFKLAFIGLILLNTFHYFDLFHFNRIVEPFYAPKHHLDSFGLNSIGQPSTKRMLGTLGNPNNNAILFVLCLIYFLPGPGFDLPAIGISVAAILATTACQSRTGIICLVLILLLYLFWLRSNKKVALLLLGAFLVFFQLFEWAGNTYLGSLGDAGYLESARIGRLEQWNRILNAMPGHWIIGHGVNKAYFEANGIYAESEYFLVLFRYGLLGLLALMGFWLAITARYCTFARAFDGKLIFGSMLLFVLTGITNSPLHVIKLSVLLTFFIGTGLRTISNGKQV